MNECVILQHQTTCPPSKTDRRTHKGDEVEIGEGGLGFWDFWEFGRIVFLEENGRE